MAGIFVQQEDSGLLFKNDNEEGSKRPDISGYINVRGEQFRIALWENEKGSYGAKIQDSDAEPNGEAEAPKKSYGASSGGNGGGGKKTFTKPNRR